MSQREHSAGMGVVTSALSGIVSLLAGVILLPLVFRTVGSGPYGVWIVLSTMASISQYSDLGIGSAVVHFSARARAGSSVSATTGYLSAGLLWSVCAGIVLLPVFFVVSMVYVSSGTASSELDAGQGVSLCTLAVVALASFLLKPFQSALVGEGLLPIDRRNQLIASVLRILGTTAICLTIPNVLGVAAVEAIAILLPGVLASIALMRRRIALISWSAENRALLKPMLRYSIQSFVVNLLGALTLQAGALVAGVALSPSSASYYSSGFRVYTAARQVLTWVIEPFRSAFSRQFALDIERTHWVLYTLCFTVFSLSLWLSVTVEFAAQALVQIWLGPDIPQQEIVLTLLVLFGGLLVNSLYLPFGMASDAKGQPGAFLAGNIVWLALSVPLSILLVGPLGIVGVAIGLSAPLLVCVPLNVAIAHRRLGLGLDQWWRAVVRPSLSFAAAPVLIALVTWLIVSRVDEPFLASIVSTGIYIIAQAAALLIGRRWLPFHGLRELFGARL